jgi:hypothetical protein
MKTILCCSVIFQINTQLEMSLHNGLEEFAPLLSLRRNKSVELFQSNFLISLGGGNC